MLEFLRRTRLVKQGYACPKTRRRKNDIEFLRELDGSTWVRYLIFALFVAGLAAIFFYGPVQEPTKRFLVGLLVFLTTVTAIYINHPQTYARNALLALVFGVMLAHLAIIKFVLMMVQRETIPLGYGSLLIPYAFAPLVLCVLLGKNHGILAAIFVSLWGSVIHRSDHIFLVISLITGFIAVFLTMQVRRRGQLLRAGVYVGAATLILAFAFGMIEIYPEALGETNWRMVGFQCLLAVGTGVLTAVLVSGTLPVLESVFHITTDISWLETADLNHPLLKRMTIEAPGTYHHSLVIASLAEAAAEKIGANPVMCRVCAYFHDIGKLVKPDYFTENMRSDRNPHDDLAPTMSALIIIAHVKEGVDLALKHNLNQRIIDVIQQHHGTSLVYYFYRRAKQQEEDARAGGKIMNIRAEDIPEVKEEIFRYVGPKPQFKESGIISLADMVESASRSLVKPTPQKIEQLVHDLIEKRLMDRQLDDCDLTLREIRQITDSFVFTLQNMMHTRIAYPKDEPAESSKKTSQRMRAEPAEEVRRESEEEHSQDPPNKASVA